MPTLYGRHYTRGELQRLTGNPAQIAGARLYRLVDGAEDGVLAADLTTGTGLCFTVLASRGLDISGATRNGRSVAWRSAQGDRHPAYYEPDGIGWLRNFPGGLLTTCGLTWMGAPDVDAGVSLGVHGRASNTPATEVHAGGVWDGDEYIVYISGSVRESVLFGCNVVLRRRIWARAGEDRLFVDDVVANEGFETTPHMLLYHCNIGFPFVDAGSRVVTSPTVVTPRDDRAAEGADRWMEIDPPETGFAEQVFFHDLRADADGMAVAGIANPNLDGGSAVYVRYRTAGLPHFVQWRCLRAGEYVVGLEPSNAYVLGRSQERTAGRLQMLEPGETRSYHLEIGVTSIADLHAMAGVQETC